MDRGQGSAAGSRLASPERWLQWLLCLLVFSLPLMQPPIALLGFAAIPADFVSLGLAAAFLWLAALGRALVVLDRAYGFIAAYLLAMILSAVAAQALFESVPKLLTQIFLLSLPIIVCSLVRDLATLRFVVLSWIGGAAIVAVVGLASLAVFAVDPDNVLLDFTRFHFGTLPPGEYPRLRLTFLNANLACNYLTVSILLLLAARRLQWVGRKRFWLLLGAMLIAAATTISPGLGGIAGGLGLWLWLTMRDNRPAAARAFLAAGAASALLFLAAMAVTPILHPTAPFLIQVPLTDLTLAPAGRLMIWIDAARNFALDPVFGRGIGSDAVQVSYLSPSGFLQRLTDAHNIFLNIAVQCGLVGLAALLALLFHLWRRTLPLRMPANPAGVIRLGLGLAVLNGLVYQGLGGSFEDARHLWVAIGLLLASGRIERALDDGRDVGLGPAMNAHAEHGR